MKEDWDRRISHDYRFWMSDGHKDDAHMWATGERDFGLIAAGISGGSDQVALEIGCGVGRMLRAARKRFGKVIGTDISANAINKAKNLIGEDKQTDLIVTSGVDLGQIPDQSLDFIWSFASLTSMPTHVIAGYLAEARRVLKPNGTARLQVYLGQEMAVNEEDTLHLRCFTQENFSRAAELAGLKLSSKEELVLPFQVSFKDIGVEAFIVTLQPTSRAAATVEEISATLLPNGEADSSTDFSPSELEAWMTVSYAQKLLDEGDYEKARQAIQYVETYCRTATIDTQDLLNRIADKLATTPQSERSGVHPDPTILDGNLRALRDRFPDVFDRVASIGFKEFNQISVEKTAQGPVVYREANCLDHAEKPRTAAEVWINRAVGSTKNPEETKLLIAGFGSGYHVEVALERFPGRVSCLEPDLDVFRAVLTSRDITNTICGLSHLSVGSVVKLPNVASECELLIRPQVLATMPDAINEVKAAFYGKRGLTALAPKIAVLGPIQGGTIPTGQYTYNALMRLGQRARGMDMSGFNPSFMLLDQFVTSQPRKNFLHGTYVEMLSTILLETFTEKPIDILICMAQAPISIRVLTELRKRGVVTVLWFVEDYLRFTYWREVAPYYDFIFTIQKGECLDGIKRAGAGGVHYLPVACDPYFHVPMTLSLEDTKRWGSPISFVGAGYHNRQQMFAALAQHPFKIWGSEWPQCKPFDRLVQDEARRVSPEEYLKIFNATEINLNLHSSTERDGVDPFGDFVNPRTFELAACGAFQLTDERSLLPEMFEPGKEIITFKNVTDLKEKIDYYLAHPEERTAVAQRGRDRALRDHTYEIRIAEMLSVIYAAKFEHLRSRNEQNPWIKMIKRSETQPELHSRCKQAFERGEEATLDALISDIATGNGKLTETEQKLLFLYHVRKQIIRMTREEAGGKS